MDYGETLEAAAIREAKEETGMDIKLVRQFHSYSDPLRDLRHHTISTVFVARASGTPKAGDDASDVALFSNGNLPVEMAFDHREILNDYFSGRY